MSKKIDAKFKSMPVPARFCKLQPMHAAPMICMGLSM